MAATCISQHKHICDMGTVSMRHGTPPPVDCQHKYAGHFSDSSHTGHHTEYEACMTVSSTSSEADGTGCFAGYDGQLTMEEVVVDGYVESCHL